MRPTSAFEVTMIQLILTSPFQSQDLEQALAYRQPEDVLVLMQDAVVAATAPQWCARLSGVPLYVMREDLQARGLQQRIGLDLDMAGLVALIAEKGSPQTWAG
ncbi:sulfurtransferase complex subunit TusB [Aeromonas hydrophila]|nr:sulfurtransferase complex subunit TusB [Aeromonas hydrophila]TNH99077.1 sulfurtransferase complex subunit TusB [Aeromonas hydrophila]TNI93290.1 sulfurtransferase complex subunit TusB [Aeromonas hydrophila]